MDLLPGVSGTDEQKANTIYACTVLGFCAVHFELGHKYAFEGEAPSVKPYDPKLGDGHESNKGYMDELKGYQVLLDILSALAAILEDTLGKTAAASLKDNLSPTMDFHNRMICGWPGGHTMKPHDRVFTPERIDDPRNARPRTAQAHRDILGTLGPRVTAEMDSTVGFCGDGAYTGAIREVNPERQADAEFSSTTQCFDATNPGERWHPPGRGVIESQHKEPRPKGLGTTPPSGPVVGYSHGMNYAIRDALAQSATSVALEISAGAKTTKQASCFGCTTYMWANGYPPSATHLGSALSWHPIPANKEADAKKKAIVEAMNLRHHLQVHSYLLRGAEIFMDAGSKCKVDDGKPYYITTTHTEVARGLRRLQKDRDGRAHEVGANFFLDACTYQLNDKVRLKNAILNLFDGTKAMSK